VDRGILKTLLAFQGVSATRPQQTEEPSQIRIKVETPSTVGAVKGWRSDINPERLRGSFVREGENGDLAKV
jgi:hypothetical protein